MYGGNRITDIYIAIHELTSNYVGLEHIRAIVRVIGFKALPLLVSEVCHFSLLASPFLDREEDGIPVGGNLDRVCRRNVEHNSCEGEVAANFLSLRTRGLLRNLEEAIRGLQLLSRNLDRLRRRLQAIWKLLGFTETPGRGTITPKCSFSSF